jgi:hypothetical protein
MILWAALLGIGLVYLAILRKRPLAKGETWGCGYAAPTQRMQYRARSFAELLSERVLPPFVRPKITPAQPVGPFPEPETLQSDYKDPLTRRLYEPAFSRFAGRLSSLTWLQRGALHMYLVYILSAILGGLLWASLSAWSGQ